MEDNKSNGSFSRPMVKGNWQCSDCKAEITQLPFQPDESRLGALKCIDCHRKGRSNSGGGARQSRPMVSGSWACSKCGKEITQLPFEPKGDRPITCNDCFKASRPPREERRW